jgi:hypothetical protein
MCTAQDSQEGEDLRRRGHKRAISPKIEGYGLGCRSWLWLGLQTTVLRYLAIRFRLRATTLAVISVLSCDFDGRQGRERGCAGG